MNRLLMAIPVLIFTILLLQGCYTIVGYSPEVERGAVEVEPDEGQVYRYGGYYDTYPYSHYWDYYDPYYNYWSPHYYYRDYYPWRYYDDYYYRDYGGRHVPEKRPGTRRRGVEPQRSPRPEQKESRLKEDKDEKSSREVRDTRRGDTQRSVRQKNRDSSSDSSRRAPGRTPQDEEKNE